MAHPEEEERKEGGIEERSDRFQTLRISKEKFPIRVTLEIMAVMENFN